MVDGGNYMKTIYRTLKQSVLSTDSVIKFHSECALGELDEIMRKQLFLSESQLRGENLPKIRIL